MQFNNFKPTEKDETKLALACPTCGKRKRDTAAPAGDVAEGSYCVCSAHEPGDGNSAASAPPPVHADSKEAPSQYTVVEKLGEGGMATVFRVRDSGRHEMAMKVMNTDVAINKAALKRFVKEVSIVSNLTHPNIAQVYGCFTPDEGNPYMMMEYVDGLTLAEIIKHEHHISPARAIDIGIQICEALQHAHMKQVIHRDLKPSNIIVSEAKDGGDNVKLLDFGIAKAAPAHGGITELTQKGEVFGSPFCMSPEQCKGVETDARSDIYSLGCVMFEILTGETMFTGENSIQILLHHINTPIKPAMRKLKQKGIPGNLCAVIEKMMAKNPARRYQSATEVLSELKRLKLKRAPAVVQTKVLKWAAASITATVLVCCGIAAVPQLFGTNSNNNYSQPIVPENPTANLVGWTVPAPLLSNDPEAWIARVKRAAEEGAMGRNYSIHISNAQRISREQEYQRIRNESFEALLHMGPRIIPCLIRHLGNLQDDPESFVCADVLSSFGEPSIDPLLARLHETIGTDKAMAAEQVLLRLAPASDPAFLKLIESNDQEQRRVGAVLLASSVVFRSPNLSILIQTRDAGGKLNLAMNLRGPSRGGRQAESEYYLDSAQLSVVVKALAKESAPDIRANLAIVLAGMAGQSSQAEAQLIKLLKDDRHVLVRLVAASGLSDVMKLRSVDGNRSILEALLFSLKNDPDGSVRSACIDALIANMDRISNVVPELQQSTHDPLEAVHLKALQALCNFFPQHPECRSAVDQALRQTDFMTASAALRAVGRMGASGASYTPIICDGLARGNTSQVTQVLKQIGPSAAPQAVPILIEHLQRASCAEKGLMIDTLVVMGPEAKKAIPELQRIIDSSAADDLPAQPQARQALERLKQM